jgi:predicted Zn-dependent protease
MRYGPLAVSWLLLTGSALGEIPVTARPQAMVFSQTEIELAMVQAHEMAHVPGHHHGETLSNAIVLAFPNRPKEPVPFAGLAVSAIQDDADGNVQTAGHPGGAARLHYARTAIQLIDAGLLGP